MRMIWLPERITLITVGQDFVAEGQTVHPIDETNLTPESKGNS